MKYLLLVLLISFDLSASEDCITSPHHQEGIQELVHVLETLESDIENAPCKAKEPPTQTEIKNLIDKKRKSSSSGSVHGVNFVDEDPALIESFKELTTAVDFFAINPDPNRQIDIQKNYSINPGCTKVDCAVKKIWGETLGPKILYMKLKHGFNGSELVYENSDRFNDAELDDVVMGLEDLPMSWAPVSKNKRMTHFKRGSTLKMYEGRGVAANAMVMLFDIWSDYSPRRRQEVVFHEIAHVMSDNLGNMDDKPEWLNLTGWVKKEDKWSADPSKCQVTEYGATNPAEDWAETLMVYRYKGAEFKKTCPEKYDFVKKHAFKDLEYISTESCSEIPQNQLGSAKGKLKELLVKTSSQPNLNEGSINTQCAGIISDIPVPESELQKCNLSLLLDSIPGESINQLMTEQGIENNSKNRNILFSSLQKDLAEDKSYITATKSSSSELSKKFQTMTAAAIDKSLPIGVGGLTDGHLYWWYAEKKCGELYFKGNLEDIRNCISVDMVNEDNKTSQWREGIFPSFAAPKFLNEKGAVKARKQRDHKLQEQLAKDETFKKLQAGRIRSFQTSLELQAYHASKVIPELPKDLAPKEFCLKTYGGAASYLERLGYSEGQPLPVLQKWCEEVQATKTERFEISYDTWLEKVSSILPK